MSGYITIDELIELIGDARIEKDVLVRSDDFYARPGDTSETTICYVDAYKLIEGLKEHGQQTLG